MLFIVFKGLYGLFKLSLCAHGLFLGLFLLRGLLFGFLLCFLRKVLITVRFKLLYSLPACRNFAFIKPKLHSIAVVRFVPVHTAVGFLFVPCDKRIDILTAVKQKSVVLVHNHPVIGKCFGVRSVPCSLPVFKGFLHSAFQLFAKAWVLLRKGFKALRVVRFVVQGFKPRLLHTGIAEILVCTFYRVPVRLELCAALCRLFGRFSFGHIISLCGLLNLLWCFLLGLCGGFCFLPCGGFLCSLFLRRSHIKLVKHFLVLCFLFGGLLFRGFLLRLCGGFLLCLSFCLHISRLGRNTLCGACGGLLNSVGNRCIKLRFNLRLNNRVLRRLITRF